MDADRAMRRVVKQLQSGNDNASVPSPFGAMLPPEDELRSRVDVALKSIHRSSAASEILRTEIESFLQTLYGKAELDRAIVIGPAPEAVLIADGSRPIFFLENDKLVPCTAPTGPFVEFLTNHHSAFENASLSVGRIESDEYRVTNGSDCWYAGTAFMAAANLAITNRHVMQQIIFDPTSGGSFSLNGEYWLNFAAEFNSPVKRRFKIKRVVYARQDVIGRSLDLSKLDLAVLEIGAPETPDTAMPPPLPLTTKRVLKEDMIAVIGYPSKDNDLEAVLVQAFKPLGYKRCASGEVDALPGFPGDSRKWTIKHDASTLCGNSGSPVLILDGETAAVSALHFGGQRLVANFAHVFDQLAEDFGKLGITLQ